MVDNFARLSFRFLINDLFNEIKGEIRCLFLRCVNRKYLGYSTSFATWLFGSGGEKK